MIKSDSNPQVIMSEVVLSSSARQRLEPYLLLSKSAKGGACVQLIKDALAAPGVYVFAELLEMPNVAEVYFNYKNCLRLTCMALSFLISL